MTARHLALLRPLTRTLAEVKCVRLDASCTRFKSTTAPRKRLNDHEYCMNLVKETDFNSYLATLVMPKSILRSAFALRAFSIELLSIGRHRSAESTSISQMKLQFWKDQIGKIYEFAQQQQQVVVGEDGKKMRVKLFEPVSNELALAVQTHGLSKTWFNRLIDGRRSFFSVQQFKTLEELEKCADASMSTLYYILLQCLGIKSMDCDHAASHLGKAEMLTGIARHMLRPSSQTVYYLPMETLAKHGIAQQDLFNRNEKVLRAKHQQIKDLAFEVCSRANQHLKSARSLSAKVPAEARIVFASAVQLEIVLREMERLDFDLLSPKLNSDFRVPIVFRTILAKLRNTY